MRRAQTAIEFTLITSLLLLMFAVGFIAAEQQLLNAQEAAFEDEVQDVLQLVRTELAFAANSGEGYERLFIVPETISGIDYEIELLNNESASTVDEIVVTVRGQQYVLFIEQDLNGTIEKGPVRLRGGEVTQIQNVSVDVYQAYVNDVPKVFLVISYDGNDYTDNFEALSPANLQFRAEATDDESVASVELYESTNLQKAVNGDTLDHSLTSMPADTYNYVAKAVDNDGAVGFSKTITVRIKDSTVNTPPDVFFYTDDYSVVVGNTTALYVDATDIDGDDLTLVSVKDDAGGTYTFTEDPAGSNNWRTIIGGFVKSVPGDYLLTARVSDGKTETIETITIRVYEDNSCPQITDFSVHPISPLEGETVTVTAKASDPEGDAYLLEIHKDGEPVAIVTNQDATYTWVAVPGEHTFTALVSSSSCLDAVADPVVIDVTEATFIDRIGVSDGLAVLYTFKEGTGTTSADVSGSGFTGTDLFWDNGVNWIDTGGIRVTQSNRAKTSEGAISALIDSISANDQMSFEAWIAPDGIITERFPRRLISMSANLNPSFQNFVLGYGNSADVSAAGFQIRIRTANEGDAAYTIDYPELLSLPSTHHVVVTYEAGESKFYLDGELVDSEFIGGSLAGWSNSYAISVGNEYYPESNTDPSTDRHFPGDIYLIGIYDTALDPDQVRVNYNAGLPP